MHGSINNKYMNGSNSCNDGNVGTLLYAPKISNIHMPQQVSIQMTFLLGAIRTIRTCIRLLSGVNTQVGFNVVPLFEQFSTEYALEEAFSLLLHHWQIIARRRALWNEDSQGSAVLTA